MTYIPKNPDGQASMEESQPVVLAGDHSTIKVHDEDMTEQLLLALGERNEPVNGDHNAAMGLNARVHILTNNSESIVNGIGDIIDQNTTIQNNLGYPNEVAATSDTAASGINGRLKRLNQQFTSLLNKLPSLIGKRTKADSLSVTIASDEMGQTTKANSLPVTLASDQGAISTTDSRLPAALGQTTKALSLPVTLASDQGNVPTADSTVATNIGATNEAAASSDTATSGLNGLMKRLLQKNPALGQTTKAGSVPVTLASDQGNLPTVDSAAGTLLNTLVTNLGAPGDTPAVSNSQAANINQKLSKISGNITETNITYLGPINDVVPSNDTDPATINGRLQRIAQRLTSLIGLLPSSLGQKNMASSLAVTIASNQSSVPISVADGSDAAMGAKGDAAATTDTGSASEIALLKRLLTKFTADQVNAALSNTNRLAVGGSAADLSALTALTAGNAAMFRFDKETGAAICTIGDIKAIYDSITISEKIKKVFVEITRPSDTTQYAVEDMIFSSTSTGSLNITGISTGLTDSDSSGYVIAAKLLSNEQNIIGKRLAVLAYDAGTGSYQSQDNAASITGSYTIEKDKLFQIDFDTIVDCIGNPASDDAVVCKLEDLRIPYKLNVGTKFNLIFITKDVFTPTSGSKFYIELTLTTNP